LQLQVTEPPLGGQWLFAHMQDGGVGTWIKLRAVTLEEADGRRKIVANAAFVTQVPTWCFDVTERARALESRMGVHPAGAQGGAAAGARPPEARAAAPAAAAAAAAPSDEDRLPTADGFPAEDPLPAVPRAAAAAAAATTSPPAAGGELPWPQEGLPFSSAVLLGKSVGELRKLAEQRGVSLHGCLEKSDIVLRLQADSGVTLGAAGLAAAVLDSTPLSEVAARSRAVDVPREEEAGEEENEEEFPEAASVRTKEEILSSPVRHGDRIEQVASGRTKEEILSSPVRHGDRVEQAGSSLDGAAARPEEDPRFSLLTPSGGIGVWPGGADSREDRPEEMIQRLARTPDSSSFAWTPGMLSASSVTTMPTSVRPPPQERAAGEETMHFCCVYGTSFEQEQGPAKISSLRCDPGVRNHVLGHFVLHEVRPLGNVEDLVRACCTVCKATFAWNILGEDVTAAKRRRRCLPCGHYFFKLEYRFSMLLRDQICPEDEVEVSVSTPDARGELLGCPASVVVGLSATTSEGRQAQQRVCDRLQALLNHAGYQEGEAVAPSRHVLALYTEYGSGGLPTFVMDESTTVASSR